jgi:hypothetical protein
MITLIEFAEKVKEMRIAQKEYFRTKASVALVQSKKLEKDVDQICGQVGIPARTSQTKLL